MINPNSPPDSKPENTGRIPLILAVLHIFFTILLIIVGIRVDVSEMLVTATITGVIAIAGMMAFVLARRGNVIASSWVMILAIAIGVPLVTVITEGFGWVSFFSIAVTIILISGNNLPRPQSTWAILLSLVSSIVTLLIELFYPFSRPEFPNANIISPIAAAAVALVFIFIISRQFARYTLRVKLLIFFLAVALLPISILTWINNQNTTQTLTLAANQGLTTSANLTALQIDTEINNILEFLQTNASDPVFQATLENQTFETRASVIEKLIFMFSQTENANLFALLGRQGEVIANYPLEPQSSSAFLGLPPGTVNQLQVALLTEAPVVSRVIFDQDQTTTDITDLTPAIYFAVPIVSENSRPLGFLIARYTTDFLQDLVANNTSLAGQNSYAVIFNENQLYVAHGTTPELRYTTIANLSAQSIADLRSNGRLPNVPVEEFVLPAPNLSTQLRTGGEFFSLADPADENQSSFVAVAETETQPWTVAFYQTQDTFLSLVEEQTRTSFFIVLIIAGVVALLSLGATRLITAPISNLTELVERIASGELTIMVPVTTDDEIGRLSAVFNTLTTQTRNLLSGLETQIIRRTQELERQTVQLQTAAEVARDASSIQDLDTLITHAVNLISERFDFYHAGIFLLDKDGEYAVLRAANSEGGRRLIENKHQLRVGEVGIVGTTVERGAPHIALDVDIDADHFVNPYLPETRSEMALPLKIGNRVIGALDVQSKAKGAFDESDIEVLQIMADQLAIAIENTQLLAEVQSTVLELQTAYGEYTTEAWLAWLQSGDRPRGYQYRGTGVETINDGDQLQISSPDANGMIIPLKMRGEKFGEVQIQFEDDSVPEDLSEIIQIITDRLAITLDSARLFEDAQRRATQEQISGEIASRIRQSLDIDSVVRTATQEIGERLGLHKLSIHLDMSSETHPER